MQRGQLLATTMGCLAALGLGAMFSGARASITRVSTAQPTANNLADMAWERITTSSFDPNSPPADLRTFGGEVSTRQADITETSVVLLNEPVFLHKTVFLSTVASPSEGFKDLSGRSLIYRPEFRSGAEFVFDTLVDGLTTTAPDCIVFYSPLDLGTPTARADLNTTNSNPGDPGWGMPGGQVDGADLSFYVEQWIGG